MFYLHINPRKTHYHNQFAALLWVSSSLLFSFLKQHSGKEAAHLHLSKSNFFSNLVLKLRLKVITAHGCYLSVYPLIWWCGQLERLRGCLEHQY